MNIRDVIIIGAGPSGLFAALHLPVHLSVLILEKTEKAAQKLLMSAKGRGNLTNVSINPLQDYVSDDSSFVQQALDHYSSADLLHFLETNNIEYFQEENGKILLKSEKVSQFHDFLLQQLEKKKIEINYGQEFLTLQKQEDGLFQLQTSQGLFLASKVILATGTKSVPDL
ncbi:MAG: NAD(P)/FAD-dependent oxidoreductase [Candidatus Peribacteria bacterium]|jgi:predicted Rossmann fold flavoprotein|nr:NAD(P)/FAD-dependent oxidoreductase [Candidatus Peribacteria bacterium]